MKTCGTKETALKCIRMLDKCLETGKLDLTGEDMPEEMLVKTIKAVGKIGGIKGLMPTRTSTLPINEINLSGNSLLTPPSPTEHSAAVKANLKRRAETVQLIVQFVRVSTEARTVIFDNCNLEGYSHDKDDLVELEIVRLVKKFGAGKNSRYAEKVSLSGNRFGQEFCRRIIEGAYWERNRHTGPKETMPKLFLDLSKNRIIHPERIVDELKEGKTAGGPMSLATTTDPEHVRKDALIVLDISGQRDHSPSAPRAAEEAVSAASLSQPASPVAKPVQDTQALGALAQPAKRQTRQPQKGQPQAVTLETQPLTPATNYNNELVKSIEDLREKREELNRQILKEEEDKAKVQKELSLLTDRLQKVNESLVRKTQARNEYDKTIQETEAAYMKILESSQTLLHVLKRETVNLTKKKQGSD
ncbi:DIP13 [Symbiodinium natans]|uniref:DIP13 protein n=1 Tax=Symbiodinium natans TaxID=878477 RepID=A0A812SEX8_9DINO|nr:DIP13 [Symbiodinium natans]